jgi:hypothetical protein
VVWWLSPSRHAAVEHDHLHFRSSDSSANRVRDYSVLRRAIRTSSMMENNVSPFLFHIHDLFPNPPDLGELPP